MQSDVDVDYVSACVDEVALEGLDGIALSAFWLRLERRPRFPIKIDEESKLFLWQVVAIHSEIEMFELPEPRPPLIIFNRYDHVDIDTGIITEPAKIPLDIYPIQLVKTNNERGSCSTYLQRKKITEFIRSDGQVLLNLEQVSKRWGEKLVLVASQKLRLSSLVAPECDPTVELTDLQFLMLERIGRSRYHGEVTQGRISLMVLKESPKNLHYQRKRLLAKNLITKQVHYQRNPNGQTTCGMLLHLTRFYVEKQPKCMLLMKKMYEILDSKPKRQASLPSLRAELGMKEGSFKKMFQKNNIELAATLVVCPLREINPDLPEDQYYHSNGKEKDVKCLRLRDDVDVNNLGKSEEDEDEENDDENVEDIISNGPKLLCIDQTLLSRTLEIIEDLGPDGAALTELSRHLGLPKLEVRLLCRNLERLQVVSTIMKDAGRQRITKYVSRQFESKSQLYRQFMEERRRILELAKSEDVVHDDNSLASENADNAEASSQKTDKEESEAVIHDKVKDEGTDTKSVKNHSSFIENVKEWQPGEGGNKPSHITSRMLRRIYLILKAVREEKFFDDIFKLQKLIMAEEEKEGYCKIDKKSLLRLIENLSKAGAIQSYKPVLCLGKKVKKLHFVCSPEIKENDPIIRSAVDRAKYKYFFASSHTDKPTKVVLKDNKELPSLSVRNSISSLQDLYGKTTTTNFEFMPSIGRFYGIEPKFIRMKVIHEFLFYLVYDYKGIPMPDDMFQLWEDEQCCDENKNANSKSIKSSERPHRVPKVYNEDKTWRMFVPPLPQHIGWSSGWCLISDVLLRLPLSIFVKVVNCTFKIDELELYLKDPVKRHYLIGHLPQNIRNALLYARRYIFSVCLIAERLAYIGLLSFGPHHFKEKDQKFIYLHRKGSLVDTTTSKASYFQISRDQDYPRKVYCFETHNDVEQYWFDMCQISLHTPLGSVNSCHGQAIIIEKLYKKPEMIDACRSKTPEEIIDEGIIPGDGLGAAGFDSGMFSHVKRNWQFFSSSSAKTVEEFCSKLQKKNAHQAEPQEATEGVVYMKYLQQSPVGTQSKKGPQKRLGNLNKEKKLNILASAKNSSEILENNSISTTMKPNQTNATRMRGQKRKRNSNKSNEPKKDWKKRNPDKIIRIVRRKHNRQQRRPYYDEIDRAALRLQSKLRVDWKPQEDSFLLLCKVATILIDPNYYQCLIVSSQCVRNLLHEFLPGSKNKTSRACQRRIVYMLKNPQTVYNVAVFVGEAKQDESIMEMIPCSLPPKKEEAKMEQIVRKVLIRLMEKFKSSTNLPIDDLPNTKEELQTRYSLVGTDELLRKANWKIDVKNIVDIHFSVVYSLILSSLSCIGDKANWSYQLYRIYQQYPDNLLRSVFTRLRNDKLISKRKGVGRHTQRILPLSTLPYQLSISYNHKFLSRYQPDIFSEAQNLKSQLIESNLESQNKHCQDKGVEIIINQEGGFATAILTLLAKRQIVLELNVPEQIIIFDSDSYNDTPDQQKTIMKRWLEFERYCSNQQPEEEMPPLKIKCSSDHLPMPLDSTDSNMNKAQVENENQYRNEMLNESNNGMQLNLQDEQNSSLTNDVNHPKTTEDDKFNSSSNIITSPASNIVIISQDTSIQEKLEEVVTNDTKNIVNFSAINRASRVALYMVRQQMSQNPAEKSQHSQDYIVVNSCKVIARLKTDKKEIVRKGVVSDPHFTQIPLPILDHDYYSLSNEQNSENPDKVTGISPLASSQIYKEIINSHSQFFNEIGPSFQEIVEMAKIQNYTKKEMEDLEDVYNFILQQREMGATTYSLKSAFPAMKGKRLLLDHVFLLLKSKVVLRVGVNIIRYVTFVHSKPWILNSVSVPKDQKILARSIAKQEMSKKKKTKTEDLTINLSENIQDSAELGSKVVPMQDSEDDATNAIQIINSEEQKASESKSSTDDVNVPTCSNKMGDEEASKPETLNSLVNPQSSESRSLRKRKRTISSQYSNEQESMRNWEKIHFLCRVWRKPDGRLNHSVLRVLLSSILSSIMNEPGINFRKVVDKFTPALQPVHVYELIEILVALKCVKKLLIDCKPADLFSRIEPVNLFDASEMDPFDGDVLLEAEVDCVLTLGDFLAHL